MATLIQWDFWYRCWDRPYIALFTKRHTDEMVLIRDERNVLYIVDFSGVLFCIYN